MLIALLGSFALIGATTSLYAGLHPTPQDILPPVVTLLTGAGFLLLSIVLSVTGTILGAKRNDNRAALIMVLNFFLGAAMFFLAVRDPSGYFSTFAGIVASLILAVAVLRPEDARS